MNKIMQRLKYIIPVFLFTFLLTTSCKKNDVASRENFQAANVALYDMWNDGNDGELSFSLDTSKPLHYGTLYFGRELDYMIVYAGNRQAKFKDANGGSTILEKNLNLESQKVYSLFLTGEESTPETVMVEDDILNVPAVRKFRIRLANMTTGSVQYDLRYAKKGTSIGSAQSLVSATAPKGVSAFMEKDCDPQITQLYTIWAVAPGKDTLMYNDFILGSQKVYTITVAGNKTSGYNYTTINTFTNEFQY